ncbi:hypothetical protein HAX54_036852 [Datura stramonium]|uniref:Ribosomal protein S3 n=1 Tax=Datura stramonium TaxID=4076 RepID=A0ABS8SGQ2_DATST|nr:hypothetical protein [Datura stramonium]
MKVREIIWVFLIPKVKTRPRSFSKSVLIRSIEEGNPAPGHVLKKAIHEERVNDEKAPGSIQDSTFQVAASWQANKNFLVKLWRSSHGGNLPSLSPFQLLEIVAKGATAFGFGIHVDNIREGSYQRADRNFVMLTINQGALGRRHTLEKAGKRPLLQSDVNSGNFEGVPRELRPFESKGLSSKSVTLRVLTGPGASRGLDLGSSRVKIGPGPKMGWSYFEVLSQSRVSVGSRGRILISRSKPVSKFRTVPRSILRAQAKVAA